MLQMQGFRALGKVNLPGTLGRHTAWPCPHLPCGWLSVRRLFYADAVRRVNLLTLTFALYSMCFLTVSSRPCLETNPPSTLRTPFAGHCLGALWKGKPCPAELSEGGKPCLENPVGRPSPANSPDTICWTLFRYTWLFFPAFERLRSSTRSLA